MAVSVETAFLIFGGIIFIGYLGDLLSKRFAVPNVLLLLAIGYLLRLSGYADAPSLSGIQGLFGSLALVMLLFDGGLSLNIYNVLLKGGRVLLNSALITLLGILGSALFFLILGFDPLIGAILGAVAGGIGSTTTISLIRSLPLPGSIRTFLTLESSITDIFSIILALVLTQALVSGSLNLLTVGQGIAAKFSVGIISGFIAGLLSLAALSRIEKGYNYMITFAIVLMLYSMTEFLNGSGAIAVLMFGIVFGNEVAIKRLFRMGHEEHRPLVMQFQTEISFFIRTFFFVFLGIVVGLGSLANFLIGAGYMLFLCLIRHLSLSFSMRGDEELSAYKSLLTAVNPRGLATAVLATYPLLVVQDALASAPDARLSLLLPQLASLPEISFYVIVLSVILTTVLVPLAMRKNHKKEESLDEMQAEAENEEESEQQEEEKEEQQPPETWK
ncbi:MAG: cation:proton antiporter [Candidatus Micrarchaeota archaeon]